MASSQAQQAEQMLLDLGADFTAKFEMIGSYPELVAEAKEDKQDEPVLPTFEQLERLKLLREMGGGSGISVTRTEMQMVELVATKEALLYAVLLFEQPDYEHLVEAHGLTGEDVDAMKMIIGPKLLTCVPKIWGVFSEMLRLRRSRGEARQCFGSLRTDSLFQYVFDVCLLLLFGCA